jgi:hypothetical protein
MWVLLQKTKEQVRMDAGMVVMTPNIVSKMYQFKENIWH